MPLPVLISMAMITAMQRPTAATTSDITLLPLESGAAALDGSPYGFYFVRYSGHVQAYKNRWTISIEGGGWCVGHEDCYSRSQQKTHDGKPGSLGSSTPYRGQQHGCSCMNTNASDVVKDGCNCILMLYLDGGSFSGNVDKPVAVPGRPGKYLHYKGLRNLDATLDYAFANLGLGQATELVVTGGSAGGLSTFLHVDRISGRMKKEAKNCKLITAAPVVGYFLDHANYQEEHPPVEGKVNYPHSGNYSSWMKTVYQDQNITAALLPKCLEAFRDEPHKCFMSPHMNMFVETPFFMFNSRFDAWQMDNDLQVPCHAGESNHQKCTTAEQAAIVRCVDLFSKLISA